MACKCGEKIQRGEGTGPRVFVVGWDLVTAYGWGVDVAWPALIDGRSAIRQFDRFDTRALRCDLAGIMDDLDLSRETSLCRQMLDPMLDEPNLALQKENDFFPFVSLTGDHVAVGKTHGSNHRHQRTDVLGRDVTQKRETR